MSDHDMSLSPIRTHSNTTARQKRTVGRTPSCTLSLGILMYGTNNIHTLKHIILELLTALNHSKGYNMGLG